MARILVVGSSHIRRVEQELHNGELVEALEGNELICVAQGGLKAIEGYNFLQQRWVRRKIVESQAGYAVIHLGGNDLNPKTLEEKPKSLIEISHCLFEMAEELRKLIPGILVFFSEMLPHARRYPDWLRDYGTDLDKQYNARWMTYNQKVHAFAKNGYCGLAPVIKHTRLWISSRLANSGCYDLRESRWWGLHLNKSGTIMLVEDIIRIIRN